MARIQEDIINDSLPEESKSKGIEKLGEKAMEYAVVFEDRMIPILEQQVIKFANDQLEKECVSTSDLEQIVSIRNGVLGQANSIVEILGGITKAINLAYLGIKTLTDLINFLKAGKIAASLSSKFLPVVPGLVPSLISDLDDLITNKTFNTEGEAKIPPVKAKLDGIAPHLAVAFFQIGRFILVINELDGLVKECTPINEVNPNLILTPVSPSLIDVAKIQNQAIESPNLSTYKGFIIEIEEESFSSTLNKKRAVGKNQDGIILVETEFSFTPSDKILIDELKLIIDKNNLEAY